MRLTMLFSSLFFLFNIQILTLLVKSKQDLVSNDAFQIKYVPMYKGFAFL